MLVFYCRHRLQLRTATRRKRPEIHNCSSSPRRGFTAILVRLRKEHQHAPTPPPCSAASGPFRPITKPMQSPGTISRVIAPRPLRVDGHRPDALLFDEVNVVDGVITLRLRAVQRDRERACSSEFNIGTKHSRIFLLVAPPCPRTNAASSLAMSITFVRRPLLPPPPRLREQLRERDLDLSSSLILRLLRRLPVALII